MTNPQFFMARGDKENKAHHVSASLQCANNLRQ